jgi:outer membrane cobalamin receptor
MKFVSSVRIRFRWGEVARCCFRLLPLTLLLGSSAFAQQSSQGPVTNPGSEPIEELIISGKRIEQTLPQELGEYGNRVQLIDAEELKKRGINDIAVALQTMVPAMYIQPKAGPFDYVDVSLQGSRSDEILWLVDGVRINNRLYNGTTPLDTLPAAMIERIEVLEGGQGLMYGTQAAAGVINVVTKSFRRESEGQVTIGFDSNDGRHVSGYARGSEGPHEFVVYGSSDDADGYQPFASEDYEPSSTDRTRSYDVQTMGAKYGFDLGDAVRLSLGYQHTNAELDYPQATNVSSYFNQREEGIANAKIDWAVSDTLGFFVKAYHHFWDTEIFRIHNSIGNPGELISIADGTYWGYKDYGVNALARFVPDSGGLEYYFGVDHQNFSGRDDVLMIADKTETVNAVFFQVRSGQTRFDKLRLAAGVRYNSPKEGQDITVWNMSGTYDLTDSLSMKASVGTAYTLPDAEQLFNIDPCCSRGNPALSAEESTNLNISIGSRDLAGVTGFGWELIAFARNVDNLISGVDDGTGTGTFVYENTDGTSEIRGWTALVHGALGESWSGNLSYTYTDAKLGDSDLQVDSVPKNTAKFLLNYNPAEYPVGASLSLIRRGDIYQTLSSGLGRQPLGSATTANLSGYLQFGVEQNHRLTVRFQNVTDTEFVSRLQREFTDDTGSPYAARLLGLPRTYSVSYDYSF